MAAISTGGSHSTGNAVDVLAPIAQMLGRTHLRRLASISRNSNGDGSSAACVPVPVIQGARSAGHGLAFLLKSDGDEITVACGGIGGGAAGAVGDVIAATLGAEAEQVDPSRTAALHEWPSLGYLTGVPRRADGETSVPSCPLADVLLESLRGCAFSVLVVALPAETAAVERLLSSVGAEAERLDRDYLATSSQGDVHREARRRRDRLDAIAQRIERGLAHGMWRVWTVVGASSKDAVLRVLGILAGLLCDVAESANTPLRPAVCQGVAGEELRSTLLESAELASLLVLPQRERIGFALRRPEVFDVDHPQLLKGEIALGTVMDGGRVTRRPFGIEPAMLTRHAFVTGQTGSGKTTFVHSLLQAIAREGIPFLVLEPAKGEYRRLAGSIEDLLVLSVGKVVADGEIPFCLNPMAFPAGCALHTHVDLLKNAFTSSFGFVPPAPYLLESAIYRAYEAAGWNLDTGLHPTGHDSLSFPTLSDLIHAIDPVVEAAGYDREVSRNLRGALRTRIGNLCMGPKGLALDTRESLPDDILFQRPLVLELRHLGADAEKAFVMSLILMRLYEVREAAGVPAGPEQLRHIVVIEEAHRLLRRQAERSGEEGNMAFEAVRAFENLIAEVRAYGEGVVLVDQLPSAMSPGALKQTSLRVVHRLLPREDRVAVGDVFNEEQAMAVALLETGEAVVHKEGMDGPLRIRVAPPTSTGAGTARSADTGDRVRRAVNAISPSLARRLEEKSMRRRDAGVLASGDVRAAASGVLLSAAVSQPTTAAMSHLTSVLAGRMPPNSAAPGGVDRTLVRLALSEELQARALQYHWADDDLCALSERLREPLNAEFAAALGKRLRRNSRPHPWCAGCPSPCLFGHEASVLARDPRVDDAVTDLPGRTSADWSAGTATAVSSAAVKQFAWRGSIPTVLNACAVGHALMRHEVDPRAIDAVFRRTLAIEQEVRHG